MGQKDNILTELHSYFDELLLKIKQSEDGLITKEIIEIGRKKYAGAFSSKKGRGHTTSTYMYGASLDKKAKFDDAKDISAELERCKNEEDIIDSMFKATEIQEQIIYDHTIWLKFDGEGNDRLNAKEGFPMVPVKVNDKIWYLSNYPRMVNSVKEDDEIYFAALTTDIRGRNQPVIVGRGHLIAFTKDNYYKDDWLDDYPWMVRYPWYCIIRDSEILDTPVENGIPMDEIWDKLGSDTYMSSFGKNEDIAEVARKHYQKAHIRLSGNAKDYIDKRFDVLKQQYGVIKYNSET
jgi:hypothetical protein